MKSIKLAVFLAVAAALPMAVKVNADEPAKANLFIGKLSAATSAELPAMAAELVAQADVKQIKQTTMDVVKAAVGLNPAAAPVIVGSISHSSPTMAGTAAGTAVTLMPDEVLAIARAAAAAAPDKAGEIVEAICRVFPADYQTVAVAVAETVPGADKEILAGIVAAIPGLANAINQVLASDNGNTSSLSMVLEKVDQIQSTGNILALSSGTTGNSSSGSPVNNLVQPPSLIPPLVPVSGTPGIHPGGPPSPGGGHNYSSP